MSEWKPIESAPKDGTWVMLTGGSCCDDADIIRRPVSAQWTNYLNGGYGPEHGRWQFAWYDGGYYGEYRSPTHWQPLPTPPNASIPEQNS